MTKAVRLAPSTFVVSAEPDNTVSRVLILVHGIRDQAVWASHFKDAMREKDFEGVVAPIVYPRYSSWPFLLGWGAEARRKALLEGIRKVRERYPNAVFDVFCHSNGTKLFAEVVAETGMQFNTAIFAGSICRASELDTLARHVRKGRFWNLCGKRDRWPLLAAALRPDLFAATGVEGFNSDLANDSFYDFGHSGAFDPDFMKTKIAPLLLFHENESEGRSALSGFHNPSTYRKIVALLLGLAVFGLFLLPWWWVGMVVAVVTAVRFYYWYEI